MNSTMLGGRKLGKYLESTWQLLGNQWANQDNTRYVLKNDLEMNWNLSEEYQDSCGKVLVIMQEIQETTSKGTVKYRESYR